MSVGTTATPPLVVLLACAAVGRTAPALAQEAAAGAPPAAEDPLEEASRRFNRGVLHVAEGRYEAALAEFLRAYDLSREWAVLYNLGQLSVTLGRHADAHRYLTRYLADGGDGIEADRRAEVGAVLADLDPRIARLDVRADVDGATVWIDGVNAGTMPLPGPVVVDPGTHVVDLRDERLPGGRERREVILAGGLTEVLAFVAAAPPPPPPSAPVEPPPAAPEEEGSVWTSWWLWTIVGAVVVGGATTAAVLLWPEEETFTRGSLGDLLLPIVGW